jgi:hypothetical protein
MKKISSFFAVLLIASFAFTSCSSNSASIEKDAKKYADLTCKYQQLATKAAQGDMSVMEEYYKLGTEATSLATEMQGKYKNADDYKAFNDAYAKALASCK